MSQNIKTAARAATPKFPDLSETPEDFTPDSTKATSFTRIEIDPNCPLAKLGELFPQGVLSFEPFPTIHFSNWDCYEAVPLNVDLADLAIAIFQPAVPPCICRAWVELEVILIPEQWVTNKYTDSSDSLSAV